MTKPKRKRAPAGTPRAPQRFSIEIPQLAVAAVLAFVSYLLVCAIPVPGAGAVRALACGLVAGFAGKRAADWWLSALVGAAGALVGLMAVAVLVPPEQVGATMSESVLAALLLAPAVAAGLCYLASILPDPRIAEVAALAIVIGLFLFGTGVLPGPAQAKSAELHQQFSMEPQPEQYGFDGVIFLRTNWLMQQGMPYYQAFIKAWNEDSRLGGDPRGLFNIRQPWIYYLWLGLPGPPGVKVLDWFVAFACVTMTVAYVAARRFVAPVAALLAPIALTAYFAMPALTLWFPLSEYWAGMAAVAFLCALVYERWNLAGVLVMAAFAFRELMLFLVPIYLIAWFVGGRKRSAIPGLVAAVVGPFALLGIHAYLSPVHGQTAGVAFWLQGGVKPLVDSLRFSGDLSAGSQWTYLAIPVVALAGAAQARPTWNRWWLDAAVIVPVVSLIVFSNGQWGYYWGAIAQPLMMTMIPLAALFAWPSSRSLLPESWTST